MPLGEVLFYDCKISNFIQYLANLSPKNTPFILKLFKINPFQNRFLTFIIVFLLTLHIENAGNPD